MRTLAAAAAVGTGHLRTPRRQLTVAAFVGLVGVAAVLLGIGAVAAPALALGAMGGLVFLIVTGRRVATGIAVFTVLMFFDRTTALQAGGVTPVKIAGAILVLLWILVTLDRRRRVPLLTEDTPVVAAIAATLLAWSLLSAFWADDAQRAVSTAFRLAQGVMLIFIVHAFVTRCSHLRVIVFAFIAGAVVAVFVGLVGRYAASSGVNDGRVSGGFDDPNELAAVLIPTVVFAGTLFFVTTRAGVRILLGAIVGIIGVVFLRTDSQAGLVALGVVLLTALAFSGRMRPQVAVVISFFLVAVSFYYTAVTQPVALQTIASDNNTSNRKTLWTVAGQMVADHPLAGVGAGNFVVREASYALEGMNLRRADLVAEGELVHNTYLEVAAELGLVGLVAFLGLIGASLAASVRAVRAFARLGDVEMEMLSRAVFIGTVGILVAYFFATNIYEKQLWLLIALGLALPNIARRAAASAGRDDGGEGVGDTATSRAALPPSVRTRPEVVPWRR